MTAARARASTAHFQNNARASDPLPQARAQIGHMSGVSQRLLCRYGTIILGQT